MACNTIRQTERLRRTAAVRSTGSWRRVVKLTARLEDAIRRLETFSASSRSLTSPSSSHWAVCKFRSKLAHQLGHLFHVSRLVEVRGSVKMLRGFERLVYQNLR